MCAPPKHNIVHSLLDWIAEHPLQAAFQRESSKGTEAGAVFASVQEQEKQEETAKQAKEVVKCIVCKKSGTRKEIPTCSVCQRPRYCGSRCQRIHWKKGHKRECASIKQQRKNEQKEQKQAEKTMEEKKAADLLDNYMDPMIKSTLENATKLGSLNT